MCSDVFAKRRINKILIFLALAFKPCHDFGFYSYQVLGLTGWNPQFSSIKESLGQLR